MNSRIFAELIDKGIMMAVGIFATYVGYSSAAPGKDSSANIDYWNKLRPLMKIIGPLLLLISLALIANALFLG
jgi:hypothetical protein